MPLDAPHASPGILLSTPKVISTASQRTPSSTAVFRQHQYSDKEPVDRRFAVKKEEEEEALIAVRILHLRQGRRLEAEQLGPRATRCHASSYARLPGRPTEECGEDGHAVPIPVEGWFEDVYDDEDIVVQHVGPGGIPVLRLRPRWRNRVAPGVFLRHVVQSHIHSSSSILLLISTSIYQTERVKSLVHETSLLLAALFSTKPKE
ncbi:hypothetical protein D9611_013876 [Ephemerocybe angulata]|uniref:Uncharacterized protein n=1 Tax=Ephemerocybe angulata TaxID=980116 RepID=A0A8H5FAC4_9AGAR|nr:hypothetical protein D9611_013876 [Tulosesus angulatus]